MNNSSENLPLGRQIWVRAFYGFNPEEAGYIGFTLEAQREYMLEHMRDGDLVLVYGAIGELTENSQKQQALGFLEVSRECCTDRDRSAQSAIDWKHEHGFIDRWKYGLVVRRAWRVRNRVHIKTIAPEAYKNENRFERTTRAFLLTPEEQERALSHPVRQVNVFGEPTTSEDELEKGVMGELLKPSRGVPPATGSRTSNYTDGENILYLMAFDGGAEILLGRSGAHVGKALVKVGRSNDPTRRLGEVNGGFPESALFRWNLIAVRPFPDVATAHRHESELKELFRSRFTSEGGEFYTGDRKDIERAFNEFCISKLHIIKGAPAKAMGVR